MTDKYTVNQVKNIMYPYFGIWDEVSYDEETSTFIRGEELEYQIRDWTNDIFYSILVCPIPEYNATHSYVEFRASDYDNIYDLLEDVFSDETIERLDRIINERFKTMNI